MFKKLSTSQRKIVNWLGFAIVVGIGFMLLQPNAGNQMKSDPNLPQGSTAYDRSSGEFYRYENYVEQGLTNILSLIKDVGEVEVFITLKRGPKSVLAQSITEDIKGEERRVTMEPVILRLEGNREAPLIIEEYQPEIRGVLVVAAGAETESIRYQIFKAVQAALHLPMYRIEVLPRGN